MKEVAKISKYKNKKVFINGEVFDSKHEYSRWLELNLLLKSGYISDLRRQVPYELIPVQREPSARTYKKGKKKGQPVPGKVITWSTWRTSFIKMIVARRSWRTRRARGLLTM